MTPRSLLTAAPCVLHLPCQTGASFPSLLPPHPVVAVARDSCRARERLLLSAGAAN
jgi:hypothetical protein